MSKNQGEDGDGSNSSVQNTYTDSSDCDTSQSQIERENDVAFAPKSEKTNNFDNTLLTENTFKPENLPHNHANSEKEAPKVGTDTLTDQSYLLAGATSNYNSSNSNNLYSESGYENGGVDKDLTSNGNANTAGHSIEQKLGEGKSQVSLIGSSDTRLSFDEETSDKKGFLCCGNSAPPEDKTGFFELFRYADKLDVLLMITGSLFMMCTGSVLPVNLYFFGTLLTQMITFDTPLNSTALLNDTSILSSCIEQRVASMAQEGITSSSEVLSFVVNKYVLAIIIIGIGMLVTSYLGMSFWMWTGDRQIRRIRTAYFNSIMRQSIGFFDTNECGELSSRLADDVSRLENGFGDKMATFVQWFSTFIGGYSIGFISSWKLTLTVIAMCPLLVITAAVLSRFMRTLVKRELQAYATAGSVAEETFASIRTVAAFGGEREAEKKYTQNLQAVLKEGIRKAVVSGLAGGMFWLAVFSIFALSFWYGAKLTREDCLNPGAIIQVFLGVLMGSLNLGNAVPLFENFANARAAASTLFKCIDAEVEIDSNSEEGLKPDKLEGSIEFTGVYFTYPARPDVQVLRGLNIKVKKGETVALVGESGCGKSTTIQLLQRFYECAAGKILIDGKDLRDYNLTWLRNYMGIVSQEPVLFASTIAENIKLGAKWGDEITQTQVETAAKEANCYDFITSLPQGFETMVGDRGVQLSGGQKQRIAIARALVRNPAILLLDEATSALDTQSEAIVQDALDKASQGRTTIVIAHRLSTVKGANKIFAFKEGKVCEEGTHDELMSDEGLYYSLVRQQLQRQEKEEQELKTKTLLRTLSSEGAAVSTSLAHIGDTASPSHMHKPLSLTCLDVDAQPGEPDAPIQFERPTSPAPLDSLAPNLRRSKRLGSTRSMTSAMSESFVFGVVPFKDAQYEFELEEAAEDKNYSTSDEDLAKQPKTGFLEILKMSQPDWHFIVVGSIAAIFTGCIQPAFALLLSEILGILSEPDPATQVAEVSSAVGYIMLVGVIATIATILQNSLFSASGDRLTVRLRKAMFATIVKQDIAFFDVKTNGVGYLINRLANQTSLVKGAAGVRIGVMIQVAATIIAALAISFAYVWELTLTVLLFLPVIALTSKLQHRLIMGHSEENKKSTEEGSQMAQEVISNMRTVTSLNRQRYFVDKFYRHFKMVYKQDMKQAFIYGIAYGVSQAMIPFMFALCFGFGGYLSVCECLPWRSQKIPFFYIFRVFAAMTFGSMSIGRATSTLPDFGKATAAAFSIRRFLEKVSAIDPSSETGAKPKSCEGKVEFSDVKFSYPSRESVQVLKGLNFTIKTGETLALVGASGCGKSTSVALLERFYDPTSGSVAIDGNNIRSLNVQWLRKNLGLVSQEPTLFDASIAYNIAYGDNEREVPMSEVIEAARKANAHDFIASLPQGYQTNVGAKGTQLSGGQKQRIAIARALVRNPAILLLDEATSALDVQSEKIVQDALEAAMSGRTAIIIAHRLSTIRNAKKIGVIDNGEIVELGTHDQLLSARGFYYNLVNYQL